MNKGLILKALSQIILISSISVFNIKSQNVSYKTAKTFAEQLFTKQNLKKKTEAAELAKIYSNENKDTLLYIFNSSKGYVVLSADYSVYPVLGYSDEGKFIKDDINPSLEYWLNNYAKQVYSIKSRNSKVNSQQLTIKNQQLKINAAWNNYLKNDLEKSDKTDTLGVKPLVTAKWDQGKYYNYYSPLFEGSKYDGRCVTGCVATAMGMILKYYGYPLHGYGSNTFRHPHYGNISVDFNKETFDWANIPNQLPTYKAGKLDTITRNAISRLIYDCGVATDMNFTPIESGSNIFMAGYGFYKYFNYRNTISLESRGDMKYNKQELWNSMLADNLEEKHPIIYGGFDATYGGHAWICDGYFEKQSTYYFHMNWGWSGAGNGYFVLDNLDPLQTYNFSAGQQALINIMPYFAPYCVSKRILTDSTREINNGSGSSNYWNNTHCDWLIKPSYAKEIVLKFNSFSTEANNDVVSVYDGDTTSAPLLLTIAGTTDATTLSNITLVAKSGKMLITFNANDTIQGEGWDATYHTYHIVNPPKLIIPANDSLNTPAEVTLKWGPLIDTIYNYHLQLSTIKPTDNTHFTKILRDSSFTATNLLFGKTYYWRVKSFDKNNDSSAWSGIDSFKVINTVFLKNPANNINTVKLPVIINWTAIDGVKNYIYQVDISPDFITPYLITGINNKQRKNIAPYTGDTLTSLSNGNTYYWRVKASDSTSQSLWSPTYNFSVLRNIKQPVQLVSPADSSINQPLRVTLTWNRLQPDSIYMIELNDSLPPKKYYSYKTVNNSYSLSNNILLFGHTYYWRVQCNTKTNFSPWSNYYSFTVANSLQTITPANGAVNQPINSITLVWTSLAGAKNYELQLDTISDFTTALDSSFTGSTKVLSGLANLTTYYWRVRAINGKDTSAWSNTSSFTTIDKHLAVPELILPNNNSVNQILPQTLKWSMIKGATSYRIELDTSISFNSQLLFNTINTKPSLTISKKLLFNTEYFWRVKAKNNTDSSKWSAPYSFLTIDSMSSAPKLFLPVNSSTNQMPNTLFLWNKISGATKYVIQTDTSGLFTNPYTETITSNQINLGNLKFGVKYNWRVKALNNTDTTNWSDTFYFNVINNPVTITPADFAINQAITGLEVSWKNISGITGYQCELDTNNKFNSSLLLVSQLLTDSTNIYKNLLFASRYFLRVRAINENDTSAWSTVTSFTTQKFPEILSPVNHTSVMPDFTLVFTSLAGATEYDYRIDTTLNFNTQYLMHDSTYGLNTYNIKGLMLGTKYYIEVRARNNYTSSLWSLPVVFYTTGSLILISPNDNAVKQSPLPLLEWNNITGAYQYNYVIDVDKNFNSINKIIGSTANSIYNITNILKYGTKYYWQIQAQNSFKYNKSINSDIRSFTTIDTVVAVSPGNNFSLGTSKQVTFKWASIPGVVYYELQYDKNPSFTNPVINKEDGSLSSAIITGFIPNTSYWWRIRAISSYPDTTKWSRTLFINNVKNITQGNSLKISPNPANDYINFETSVDINTPVKVSILSITGQTIYNDSIYMTKNVKYRIDISGLNIGIYILEIDYGKGKVYKKLIKQ